MSSVNYLDKVGTMWLVGKIKTLLAGKVDKIEGKSLSRNDFTDYYKEKLDNAASASSIPTELSDLSSDTDHRLVTDDNIRIWNAKQDALVFNTDYDAVSNKAATMKDVDDAISSVTGIEYMVVEELPDTGKTGVIYLVAKTISADKNIYDEYIWLMSSSSYEKIGTTDIDLTNYVQFTDLVSITNGEIDAMFN